MSHQTFEIRPAVKFHLTYMSSWLEKSASLAEELERLPPAQLEMKEELERKLLDSEATARSALEVSVARRRKDEIKKSEERIASERQAALEKLRGEYAEPDNPVPPALVSNFSDETKKMIKDKNAAILASYVSMLKEETETLVADFKRKRDLELQEQEGE